MKKGPASFFPTTTVCQNKKVRKGSIEMQVRRHNRATDYLKKVQEPMLANIQGRHINT